jgi:hypothetical protein
VSVRSGQRAMLVADNSWRWLPKTMAMTVKTVTSDNSDNCRRWPLVRGDQRLYQKWWTKVADDCVMKVLVAGDGS